MERVQVSVREITKTSDRIILSGASLVTWNSVIGGSVLDSASFTAP